MKTKFSTLDIIAILPELRAKLCTGWRVNQIYDIDNKTYLFKLNKSIVQMKKDDDPLSVDETTANKMSFIIETGMRIHTTDFDWPKSPTPSHFVTKLRKAIRNKRIENITQIGIDRIIDMQFGTNQAANHLIVELYDRGNLILTDQDYLILSILRWRRPADKTASNQEDPDDIDSFRVGQIYPLHKFRKHDDFEQMTEEKIVEMLTSSRLLLGNHQNYKKRNKAKNQLEDGMIEINLKDLFNPHVVYGSSLLEDRLLAHLYQDDDKPRKCTIKLPVVNSPSGSGQDQVREYAKLIKRALDDAELVLQEVKSRNSSPGYIVQKKQTNYELSQTTNGNTPTTKDIVDPKSYLTNVDFYPILSCAKRKIQQEPNNLTYEVFESFDRAADVFFSSQEGQKLDNKALLAEREAMKKLNNLKIAQEKRLDDLARAQQEDEVRARFIELNCDKVENALLIIRSMLANQVAWKDIWATIKEAQSMNDPIASLITQVKFDRNEFTMKLCDPYDDELGDFETAQDNKKNNKKSKGQQNQASKFKNVDIDISLSAYANARRFFNKRRTAVNKEKKTIEVSKKAFKNVERQTKEKLKEVVVTASITKARKRYWFENFFWFISSDGYLVVAGRDSAQNEMLVKRYMKNNDIYVHADLHGAASVIIKNETSDPVPPKTLVEAGSMAVCYSSAWDSKIATTSWWVYPKQVSKTAPAGEYLTQGAFVIRGKKNFLPLSNLVLGFGFLFRLDEDSIERRKKARLEREHNALGNGDAANLVIDSQIDPENDGDEADEEVGADSDEGSETDCDEENQTKDADEEASRANSPEGPADPVNHVAEDDDEIEDGEDDRVLEHRLIDTLTEDPLSDDVILYAISMCAPYSAFQKFKYKVKVIPGSNKRGKAAKSCLTLFLHDKRASQREKDLLRALKDQDYARNIPNNVKISAAKNMKIINKRRPKKSEVRLMIS